MLRLLLFVVPLSLDTFAAAAALGIRGLPARERLKVSVVMSGFELTMPLVGLLIGRGLGSAIGGIADYAAVTALVVLGGWLLVFDSDGDGNATQTPGVGGLALLGLGLGVSLDELAIGFAIGLLGVPLVLAVLVIGLQAFLAAQLGLRVGSRLGAAARVWAERAAGVALLALGVFVLAERLA